jgi:deaminated glutathione amidase
VIVTVAQFSATTDKTSNLDTVAALVEEAAAQGSHLVVLPENAMYYNPDISADIVDDTEPIDGHFGTAVGQLARKHGIAVVAGMTESADRGGAKPANTVLSVDSDGSLLGAYRKVHLYDAFGYRESDRLQASTPSALTFKLGDLTFGVMTCYDLRFPEMARFLVDAGAHVLILPAAWAVGPAKEEHWTTLARARAIENTVYVLASGQTAPNCTGQSAVIDPMGHIVAAAGEEPGTASAVIGLPRVNTVRTKNPSLDNRRFTVAAK